MASFEKEIKKLDQNVLNVSKLPNRDIDDEFESVMSEFLDTGSSELKLCQTLKGTLDSEYTGLSNYLCFDEKKNPIESKNKFYFLKKSFSAEKAFSANKNIFCKKTFSAKKNIGKTKTFLKKKHFRLKNIFD